MLNTFWNIFVIVLTLASIAGCWWLLQWTKGISNREGEETGTTGHVWDEDLVELNNPLPRWWLYLFHLTIVFSLVYFVLYPSLGNLGGTLGWTQEGQYAEEMAAAGEAQQDIFSRFAGATPQALVADAEAMGIGRRLFGNNCAMCHGSDGAGGPGFPDLTDKDWLYGGDHQSIVTTLENGRNGMMPALGDALGEQGVREVTAFVMSLSANGQDEALVNAGSQKYGMFCAACHGPDAGGNQALGAPRLSDDIWLYGGSEEIIAQTLVQGRAGLMPAFSESLSAEQIRILAAYVQSLSQP
ncbi:MAG: cytochrome-c oxidase, cbb3-type subunit III [Xanthomonadales bacterium]|nr:cytochrome-c oxidase, cbb3-type subunit III [Xanthomonadales bacterium]